MGVGVSGRDAFVPVSGIGPGIGFALGSHKLATVLALGPEFGS